MKNYSEPMTLALNLPKPLVVDFEGGKLTSDAGLVLLAQADANVGLTAALGAAVADSRQQSKVRQELNSLIRARTLAIAGGYPEANDLRTLRHDAALKIGAGRCPLSGEALASQPTVSRFENSLSARCTLRMGLALARVTVKQLPAHTRRVVIDIDASDDPCHGQQEFEGFNAYYGAHCYLPLFVHVTDEQGAQWPLFALLRPGRVNPAKGVRALLRQAVRLLRQRFPEVQILVRADSGFGHHRILSCCERLQVEYVMGLASNKRLKVLAGPLMRRCEAAHQAIVEDGPTDQVPWLCGHVRYKAGKWAHPRDTIVKLEMTFGKLNPRYVVTNIKEEGSTQPDAETVYRMYCARGEQENRIKELKLDLNSGRTSCHAFWANQTRLLLHLAANVLWGVVRAAAHDTRWAKAQIGTLQLQLLKVAARVRESTRRITLHLCSNCPHQREWRLLHHRLVNGSAVVVT